MRVLELFSGTESVGKVARALGYDVISLDLTDATICCDIMEWDYKTFSAGYFDIIWASPPCNTFSKMRLWCDDGDDTTRHIFNRATHIAED